MALARSLVLAPDVLLLDEPLSALDPNLRKQVRAELKDIQRRVGITFLFVTHDQEEALSLSDRLGVMNGGRAAAGGHAGGALPAPANALRGVVSGADELDRRRRRAPRSHARHQGARRGRTARRARRRVVQSTFLGNCVHVEARMDDGQTVVAEVSRLGESFSEGESVDVWWKPDDELTFE